MIAPVLGGSTALIVTGALLTGLAVPLLPELEPPDEQAATSSCDGDGREGRDARTGFFLH